jgi:hypothetical protein
LEENLDWILNALDQLFLPGLALALLFHHLLLEGFAGARLFPSSDNPNFV